MKNMVKSQPMEFDRSYAAEQVRRSKHPLRRFIKQFYIRRILRNVLGQCIDFGCGAGQLLSQLPEGSIGVEVNPYLIDSLRADGHTVHQAHADIQDFEMIGIPCHKFQTLVISHVFEHLPDPAGALDVLLSACARLGVQRMIMVVPGAKGYASDTTHKTYIDRRWLRDNTPVTQHGFVRTAGAYFPGPWEWVGRLFVYNEMHVVFDRVGSVGKV